ncbi:multimerin-1-like [Lethenteron reissneri]|uniref:multimerin-1-like n=1 Tax=Lethenteron reissneri TaxID=7753 RepID=UPI002AB71049|nr:multimerin-1-like [Lethenteron reissneri]
MRPWRGLLRALVLMAMWPARFVAPLSSPHRVSREETAKPPTGAPFNSSGSADPDLTDTFQGSDGKGQARTGQAAVAAAAADLLEDGPNAGDGARGAGEWAAPHADSFWDESQGRQRTQSPWESQVTGTRAGEDVEQWELKRGPKRGSFVGVEAWRRGARSSQLQHSSSGGGVHKSRDWCAYVQTRIATSVVTNGTETFGATVAEPCPWGQGSCQNRHTFKEMTRPLYRIKHSIVTSLQWKCCPGHVGPACDLTEEAVGTASLQEHPPPPQQRAHGRQSDDNDGDTIPGVTAQLLLGLKGKGDAGSVWSAPHWGGTDGSEVDDDDYGKDMDQQVEGFEQRESRSVAHGHSATRVHSSERKVTLDSVSEELVIDLVRKLLDERLGEASRRPVHGTGGLDVTLSTPSAAQLARDLQLLQHSLSSLNDSVSQRLDDLTWRVQNLEKATSRSSEQRNTLLLEQLAHRAAVETTTRRLADEARTRAREAVEARGELASELRGDLGKMWKFTKDRLDTMNLTIAGLQVNAAPAAAAAAAVEITSNAAASKPAPESSDGGDGDEGRMKAQGSDAQKAKVVSTQDFSRFNETLKRHEYLLRDVYNQLHLFTEKLKELSYRIQEEQEASWGECNKLQDAFKASEDSLSIKLLEVQEQLLDMNKTIVIGLSPMEERFGSVMSTIHNLSTEVGHLQKSLQRRAQGTDWLDEAQSLREQMDGLILSVDRFKIDVEDLKFSRSVLGSGVRLPSPASDLESRVNSTESAARRALEQSGALGSNVSHLHRRVEQLSALTLNLLAQASLMSQHVDDLNGSFSTLMEDTLRHTLALEELGAFRDSDYDDYDGEYADDGFGKPEAKVEINLVKLSRLLSETVGAVREQSDVVLAMRSRLLALQLQVANSTSSAPRPRGGPREREETAVSFGGEFGSREDEGEPEGRADRLWERLGRLERAWFELDGQRLGRLESRLNEMAGVAAGCLDRTDALREEVDRNASALQRTLAAMASSRDAEMEALRRDLLAELSAHVEVAMRARRKDKDERRQQRKETLSKQQEQRAGKGPAALHGAGSEPGHAEAARMPGFLEPAHLTEAAQRGGRRLTRAKATHARTTWNIATAPRAGQEDGTKQRHNSP